MALAPSPVRPAPSPLPRSLPAAATGAATGAGAGSAGGSAGGPQHAVRAGLATAPPSPDAVQLTRIARAFAELFCEVECGARAAAQLAPLLAPLLYARLFTTWVRLGQPQARVRNVHVHPVSGDRCEAVAVMQQGARCRALAFRLVRHGAGWQVDAVARPEHGDLPAPAYPVPSCEHDAFDHPHDLPPPGLQPPRLAEATGTGARR